jgi:hypothetical protein
VRPPVLVDGVGGPVGIELVLQAPARLKQPLAAVARDRTAFALALCVQRAAALAQPRAASLPPRHEVLRIELDLDAILVGVIGRLGGLLALTVQSLLGLAQRPRRPSRVRSCSGSSSPRSGP